MAIGLSLGGVACTIAAAWLCWIVWRGGWALEHQHQQLEILGWALFGFLSGVLLVLTAMAVGGPLGRLKLSAGREGLNLEAEDREASDADTAA